jgi:hypothetical protein
MRQEKTKINKIRNKKGMKSRELLGKTSETYIQINWKNLEELDNFLDTYDQPKLNHEDINHFTRSITSNEIEAAIRVSKKEESRT